MMGKIIEFLISCFVVLVIVFAPIVIMACGVSGVKLDFKKRFKNRRCK